MSFATSQHYVAHLRCMLLPFGKHNTEMMNMVLVFILAPMVSNVCSTQVVCLLLPEVLTTLMCQCKMLLLFCTVRSTHTVHIGVSCSAHGTRAYIYNHNCLVRKNWEINSHHKKILVKKIAISMWNINREQSIWALISMLEKYIRV